VALKPELFIGALSGTSIDGIDVALVRFDPQPTLVASHSLPYPEELRRELLTLCTPGDNEIDRFGRADVVVGRCLAQAVNELLSKASQPTAEVTALGCHGQTIRHLPTGAAPYTQRCSSSGSTPSAIRSAAMRCAFAVELLNRKEPVSVRIPT
jgi:anhydro-N-acetylmuramic acid kinase